MELFISLVILVGLVYSAIKFLVKLLRGDVKRSLVQDKQRSSELEKDYRWRKVKVAYLITSSILVILSVGAAYNSGVDEPPFYEPSMDQGYTALFIGSALAWLTYRLILPRIYSYLVEPKHDHDK